MSGFLAEVCGEARERVAAAAAQLPLTTLRGQAQDVPAPPSLESALAGGGVAVIAEVKRASPSRGAIAAIPDAAGLARAYADGGAAAVSVLTEPRHFAGSLEDLRSVAAAVDLPVLRKDFVVDPYQVWEARHAGAAAVLLIVAALEQDELVDLLATVHQAGLTALIETHHDLEVTRAIGAHDAVKAAGRVVIGVNARDLTTLVVDPERFAAVRPTLPPTALAVAESGVRDVDDVVRLAALGADAVLVGESVATAADPAKAVAALAEAGRAGSRA